MQFIEMGSLLILGTLTIFLALVILVINFFIFKFSGNNYLPPDAILIFIPLLLIMLGSNLLLSKNNKIFEGSKELLYYFLIMAIIAVATNAIQYTPFSPIDHQLIALEATYGIHIAEIFLWTLQYPFLIKLLNCVYNTLPYQMALCPILVIFFKNNSTVYLREYYFLLFITTLLGFSIYYFYPTVGPASSVKGVNFFQEQYATGIKFTEIHQHLTPSTNLGGLIAFPSFHVIWAWLCLYLVRSFRILFGLLFVVNLSLVASCVLLGWHYLVDILGSFIVLLAAHLSFFIKDKISFMKKEKISFMVFDK